MVDRVSPLVTLLLHRLITSLTPLFALLLSDAPEAPPSTWAYFLAVAIWTLPDLVKVQINSRTEVRARLVYRTIVTTLRLGYAALLSGLLIGLAVQKMYQGPAWWVIGFAAWFLALVVEQAHLRRSLNLLAVLDP